MNNNQNTLEQYQFLTSFFYDGVVSQLFSLYQDEENACEEYSDKIKEEL